MENFQFRLLTYRLEAQIFLREVASDVLQLCLGVVVFKICLFRTQPHVTLTALHENFFFHTTAVTNTTPHLCLRPSRPMFVPEDFEHSDV